MGPVLEAKSTIVPFLEEEAEPVLMAQGCKVVRGKKKWNGVVIINYPPGSRRQELYPRTLQYRFLVTLPNGFELVESENRSGDCTGLYMDGP